jgi:uncharacterized protein (TIGR03437 family)
MKNFRYFATTLIALAVPLFTQVASAQVQPKTIVDIVPCAAGGIGVNLANVFFYPLLTGSTTESCVSTGAQTNFTTGSTSIGPGVTGQILSLNITVCNAFQTPGCTAPDFIFFPSIPNLHFDLSLIGPGPNTATCTNQFDSSQPVCGVFVATPPSIPFNSPFLLTALPTGSAVSLPIFGQVRSGSNVVATFTGVLATEFVGISPAQIEEGILNGVLDTGTYGISMIITPVASINAGGVVNAASFSAGTGVSPGEVVAIFGTNFSPVNSGTQLNTANPATPNTPVGLVSNNVDGTFVLFDGVPAPLLATSTGQIAAVVPYGVTGQTVVQVTHVLQPALPTYTGAAVVSSPSVTIPVVAAAPGIFTANSSGTGQIAMANQNGTLNSATAPAAKGSTVTFYATGEGQTSPAGVTGGVNSGSVLPKPVLPVSVSIGGVTVQPTYAGAAGGDVAGVLQVNVVVPSGITSGNAVPVVLTVGTASSQAGATMAVQ